MLSVMLNGRVVISYSSFQDYKACPFRYWLSKVQHKIPTECQDRTGTIPGNVVHGIGDIYLNGLKMGVDTPEVWEKLVPALLGKFLQDPDCNLGPKAFAKTEAQAVKILQEYSRNLFGLLSSQGLLEGDILAEFPIGTYTHPQVINDEVALTGYIDLSVTKSGKTIIADYKASESMFYVSPYQLKFYQLAMERRGLEVSGTKFLLFKLNKVRDYVFKKEDIELVEQEMVRVARGIKEGNFEALPSKKTCKWCKYNCREDCAVSYIEEDSSFVPTCEGSSFEFTEAGDL